MDYSIKKSERMVGKSNRATDWIGPTVVICHGSMDLTPIVTFPAVGESSDRQRDFRLLRLVDERGGTPRRDHSTPGNENEVFHALDAQSYPLRPVEPANHMVSDVVFEYLRADDIFAVTVMRKRQKCSGTSALIRGTFGAAKLSVNSSSSYSAPRI
jgi:hypothetical protein